MEEEKLLHYILLNFESLSAAGNVGAFQENPKS